MKNKKKTLLFILLGIIIITICGLALVLYQRKLTPVTPEGIVKAMVNTTEYSTDVTYIVKNSRGQFKEDGQIQYRKDEYTKIVLSDKEQIFEADRIIIKYFKDNKIFQVGNDFDNFYKYMFIDQLPLYLKPENNVNYYWETVNGRECLIIEYLLLSENKNFYKEIFYVDVKDKSPLGAVIYDEKGAERLSIQYNNFIKVKSKKTKDIKS